MKLHASFPVWLVVLQLPLYGQHPPAQQAVSGMEQNRIHERLIWRTSEADAADPANRAARVMDLQHEDAAIRWAAAWSLRHHGCLVESIIPLCSSPHVRLRRVSTYALLGRASISEAAMRTLIQSLGDADPLVHAHAVESMRLLGPQHSRLRSLLIERIGARRDERRTASDGTTAPPLSVLLDRLGPPQVEEIPELQQLLQAENQDVWHAALREFLRLRARAAPIVPDLRQIINSDDAARAHGAVLVLGAIGTAAQPAAKDVIRFLSRQIESVGPPLPADPAGPFQANFRNVENRVARQNQVLTEEIEALLALSPDATDARPLLLSLIQTYSSRGEQIDAGYRSRSLSPLVRPAYQLLGSPSRTEATQPAIGAMRALARLASDPPEELAALLEAPELSSRIASVKALSWFGPRAARYSTRFKSLLESQSLPIALRREIWATVGAIGPSAANVIPGLVADAKGDRTGSSSQAISALMQLSPASNPALAGLILQEDPRIRSTTLRVLAAQDRAVLSVDATLTDALGQLLRQETVDSSRIAILDAIAALGPDGRTLLPVLTECLPELPGEAPLPLSWFAACFSLDPHHPTTRLLRSHWRQVSSKTNFVDAALPIVMRSGLWDRADLLDDLKYGSPNAPDWNQRWSRLALENVDLLMTQAKLPLDERTQQSLYAALTHLDTAMHPDVLPALVSLWKASSSRNYVNDRPRFQNVSWSRHPELARQLVQEWITAESSRLKSRYVDLLLLDPRGCGQLLHEFARVQDEASIRRLLVALAGLGRQGACFADVPRAILERNPPGVGNLAQETLRSLLGADLSLLPDLIEEVDTLPEHRDLQDLVAYGPVVTGVLDRHLCETELSLPALARILKPMAIVRQRFPASWCELDPTLKRWQADPPNAETPGVLRRLAGDCRCP